MRECRVKVPEEEEMDGDEEEMEEMGEGEIGEEEREATGLILQNGT